jgi:hypothetical protein
METVLIQYPLEKVFHRLHKILLKRGFIIISSNEREGKIMAHKRRFFKKKMTLNLHTLKIDEATTRVDLHIESKPYIFKKEVDEKNSEKKLWSEIYDSF